jgi:hypothetical protein
MCRSCGRCSLAADEQHLDAGVAHDVRHLPRRGRGVQWHHDAAGAQDAEVRQRPGGPVPRHDAHAVAGLDAQAHQAAGHRLHRPVHGGVRDVAPVAGRTETHGGVFAELARAVGQECGDVFAHGHLFEGGYETPEI